MSDQGSFNPVELEKSVAFLLDAMADILAAGGDSFQPAWEDLRKLIQSSKVLDPAEVKRHAFNLAGELNEIKKRLSGQPEIKAVPDTARERHVTPGFLTKVMSQALINLASLRPGAYFDEVKLLERQLQNKDDLAGFFQNLTDFILQLRDDIWSEKVRTRERIGSIMEKLEATEKSFMDSVATSQDHLEKAEQVFTRAMATGLEEIGSLIEPQSYDLEALCSRLSEKVNQLCTQVELKKKADQVRLEALDQDRRAMARNLENTRRDYEAFTTQSHEMLREIEDLRAISLRDPLTGIYNRRAYDRQIDLTVSAVKTGELKTAALAIFDIDYFRGFNNNYGHLAGDRVLTHVARVTAATLRGDDLFFRYGGDEFVIIMPNTSQRAAVGVGEKVRQSLGSVEFKIFRNSDQTARVTVSVGVAEMEKSDDPGLFFARADQALYNAKKAGRDQVAANLSAGQAP